MSETHVAESVKKHDKELTIELYILAPEVRKFCYAKNCILQIIWDKAHPAFGICPLNQEMSEENRLDLEWVNENSRRYIEFVNLMEKKNYPPASDSVFSQPDIRRLPHAKIHFGVTDRKWISHINVGDKWDTVPVDAEGLV